MLEVIDGNGSKLPAPFSNANKVYDDNGAKESLLLQYWQIVNRWKWVILGIISAALAAGVVITLLMTPVYTATSRIEINREQQNVTSVEGLESPQSFQDDEFYQTQYSLLIARSLADRVARELSLGNDKAFFEAHGLDMETDSGSSIKERQRLAADLLLDNVVVDPIVRSKLVDVRYTSASPVTSAKIANVWVNQFIQANLDRRFTSTADARRFLERRLEELKARLEQSERDVVRYAAQKGIVSISQVTSPDGRTETGRTLVASDLEALNNALGKATAERIEAESRIRQLAGASPESLANQTLATLRQKRAEAAGKYAALMQQFEPGYPTALALQEEIRALDEGISREESRVSQSRMRQYTEAVDRERRLKQKVTALSSTLTAQRSDTIQYNVYQREADTNRQLYDSLLQRYKEIGVAGVSLTNTAIIDRADIPERASSPNLMLNLALALVTGLGLSFLTLLTLEQFDRGVRDPRQVSELFNLPLLGAVPDVEKKDAMEELLDPKSSLSEAFLSIQSSLAFSTAHGLPRSLMLTSTEAAEGKSTSVYGLANVLLRTKRNVVIVDVDMRSPSVHGFLGGKNLVGVSNFLAGESDWRSMVQHGENSKLNYIAAGPMPPNAAELLVGDRLALLISELEKEYDHVLIDAPPVLGLADAPLISKMVEGCAYIIQAERVSTRSIRSALTRLRQAGPTVYGIIVTKVERGGSGYGYGYGYGSGFEYGKETKA